MRPLHLLFIGTIALNFVSVAFGAQSQPNGTVRFSSIGDLTKPDNVESEVRHARVADPSKWPASFYVHSARGWCTSTLVGERVLLTAAHCVVNDQTIELTSHSGTYKGICRQADEYPLDDSADYALCELDGPVSGVEYESVNIDSDRLHLNQEILLTGFGCVNDDGTGGNDNVYRIGEIAISALPSTASNFITTGKPTDHDKPGVCFGDSGAAAFLINGPRRSLVSVNSQVQKLGPHLLGPLSYLSSTSTPTAVAFFRTWQDARNAENQTRETPLAPLKICGLDADAQHCHRH